jgi:hypothetical protein
MRDLLRCRQILVTRSADAAIKATRNDPNAPSSNASSLSNREFPEQGSPPKRLHQFLRHRDVANGFYALRERVALGS